MMMMATIASFFPPSFACNEVFLHDPLLPLEHPHDQKELTLRESPPDPSSAFNDRLIFRRMLLNSAPLVCVPYLEHGVSLFFPTALFSLLSAVTHFCLSHPDTQKNRWKKCGRADHFLLSSFLLWENGWVGGEANSISPSRGRGSFRKWERRRRPPPLLGLYREATKQTS